MSEGRKNDSGKLRFDLLSPVALFQYAKVLTTGAAKYASRNWEQGIKFGRVFAALNRHLWRWWVGEKFDPVDGQHHLSSVIWCASALLEFEITHPELDDRPIYTEEQRKEILALFESETQKFLADTDAVWRDFCAGKAIVAVTGSPHAAVVPLPPFATGNQKSDE